MIFNQENGWSNLEVIRVPVVEVSKLHYHKLKEQFQRTNFC